MKCLVFKWFLDFLQGILAPILSPSLAKGAGRIFERSFPWDSYWVTFQNPQLLQSQKGKLQDRKFNVKCRIRLNAGIREKIFHGTFNAFSCCLHTRTEVYFTKGGIRRRLQLDIVIASSSRHAGQFACRAKFPPPFRMLFPWPPKNQPLS